jgi:hypothetical protein
MAPAQVSTRLYLDSGLNLNIQDRIDALAVFDTNLSSSFPLYVVHHILGRVYHVGQLET